MGCFSPSHHIAHSLPSHNLKLIFNGREKWMKPRGSFQASTFPGLTMKLAKQMPERSHAPETVQVRQSLDAYIVAQK